MMRLSNIYVFQLNIYINRKTYIIIFLYKMILSFLFQNQDFSFGDIYYQKLVWIIFFLKIWRHDFWIYIIIQKPQKTINRVQLLF